MLQEKLMPTQRKETPLHRVVCGHNTDLFDEVLAAIQKHFPEGRPTGRQVHIYHSHIPPNCAHGVDYQPSENPLVS